VGAFFHAVHVFFSHLAAVGWTALALGLACHFLKIVVRTIAWRNILAAAFPESRVRWRPIFGAYVAGVGVNSIAPARGGDLVKLYLAKRAIERSTYPTLGATLIVETLFDTVAATGFLLWALTLGVLPGFDVLPDLPSVDWTWVLRHSTLAAIVGALVLLALLTVLSWAALHVAEFWRRVARGFAILRPPSRYLLGVATWQALSWVLRIASIWWFLRAFHVPATVHNALLVQVVQSLSTLLPFSPGGAGTQQGLLVFVFRGRLSATRLLSFSVGMNLAQTVVNVALGFGAIFLAFRTLRWRRVVARDKEAAAESG
jgi:uncharacterized membrane protein YbhN (UPF0104 family)